MGKTEPPKKEDPPPAVSKMGQPVDQRVPENGSLINCHPDIRIVQIGGVYYVVAFLDTGSAPDFCTKSFANKFQHQYLGQTHKVLHEGMKKI